MLKAVLQTLEGVEEAIAGLYRKEGDRFVLNVEAVDGFGLEDVAGLKTALASERSAASTARQSLKKYEGLDPDAARAALENAGKGGDKAALDSLRAELESKFERELKSVSETKDSLQKQLERELVTSAATAAIAEAGGSVELLLPHVKAAAKMEQTENGEYRVHIVGDNGQPRVTMKQGSTVNMGIGEYVDSLKAAESFAPAFAGSGRSGTGTRPSKAAGGQGGADPHSITYEDARNPSKYQAAKEAATKAGVGLQLVDPPAGWTQGNA